jgi:hypothetical protein
MESLTYPGETKFLVADYKNYAGSGSFAYGNISVKHIIYEPREVAN